MLLINIESWFALICPNLSVSAIKQKFFDYRFIFFKDDIVLLL